MTTTTKTRRPRGTGSLFRWKGKGPWWTKVYCHGKPILQSTETVNRRQAETVLKKHQHLAESDDAYAPNRLKKVTVDKLVDDLVIEYKNNDRKSVGHLEMRWRLHLRSFFNGMPAAQVTPDAVARYVDLRKRQGAANASVNRELAILKRALKLAMQCGKVKAVPHIAMLRESNTRTGFLSSKDRDALAAACGRVGLWLRSLFECAHVFGWRHEELLGLRVRQVNLVVGSVRLEPHTTKNDSGREVPLLGACRQLLTECVRGKAPDDHVFTRDDGRPVRDFRTAWANVCVEAGVGRFICRSCCGPVDEARRCAACGQEWNRNKLGYEGLILHDLRRTAARNLRRAGVAEGVIQKIGGWKTRSMFDRYSIIDQSDISDALLKLERRRETEAAEAEKQAVWVERRVESAADEDSGINPPPPAPLRN